MNTSKKIRELIVRGKIEELFTFISEIYEDDIDTIIGLQSRYNQNENDNLSGILSIDNYKQERNRIIKAILSLDGGTMDDLKEEQPKKVMFQKDPTGPFAIAPPISKAVLANLLLPYFIAS